MAAVRPMVAKTFPESLEASVKPVAAVPDAVNRQFPRVSRALSVSAQSVRELQPLVTEDVSRGGMFLLTGLDVAIGLELRLLVTHSLTGQTIAVDTVVRRRVACPPERAGLGVELFGLDEKRREEFAALPGSTGSRTRRASSTWRRTTPCSRDARTRGEPERSGRLGGKNP